METVYQKLIPEIIQSELISLSGTFWDPKIEAALGSSPKLLNSIIWRFMLLLTQQTFGIRFGTNLFTAVKAQCFITYSIIIVLPQANSFFLF